MLSMLLRLEMQGLLGFFAIGLTIMLAVWRHAVVSTFEAKAEAVLG